jgi:hypothetical protein
MLHRFSHLGHSNLCLGHVPEHGESMQETYVGVFQLMNSWRVVDVHFDVSTLDHDFIIDMPVLTINP